MDADEPISSFCRSLNSCERMDIWLLSYLSCCSLHDAPLPQNPLTMSLSGAAHHNSAVREDKFESKLAWEFFFLKKSQFPADVFSILSPVLLNHGGFECPKLMRKTATATQNAFEPEKLSLKMWGNILMDAAAPFKYHFDALGSEWPCFCVDLNVST